jgi:hypothetical protein
MRKERGKIKEDRRKEAMEKGSRKIPSKYIAYISVVTFSL